MTTEEDLQAAYERACSLGLAPEARDAWTEYWGLAEQRRDECAASRQITGPIEVPQDALTRALVEQERAERQRLTRLRIYGETHLGGYQPRLYEPPVRFSPEGLAY